jgi:hypothetical protein
MRHDLRIGSSRHDELADADDDAVTASRRN